MNHAPLLAKSGGGGGGGGSIDKNIVSQMDGKTIVSYRLLIITDMSNLFILGWIRNIHFAFIRSDTPCSNASIRFVDIVIVRHLVEPRIKKR